MCKQNMIQKKGKIIMNGQIICVSVIAVLLVLIGFITSGSIMKRTSDEGMAEFGMFLSCLIMIPCIIFPVFMVLVTVKEADMENNIESALNKTMQVIRIIIMMIQILLYTTTRNTVLIMIMTQIH